MHRFSPLGLRFWDSRRQLPHIWARIAHTYGIFKIPFPYGTQHWCARAWETKLGVSAVFFHYFFYTGIKTSRRMPYIVRGRLQQNQISQPLISGFLRLTAIHFSYRPRVAQSKHTKSVRRCARFLKWTRRGCVNAKGAAGGGPCLPERLKFYQ